MCKECKEEIEKLKKEFQLKVKTADLYVRKHPWESVGIAAGVGASVGLVVGYLAGKN